MYVHDWTKVRAGDWHAFHISWVATMKGLLNRVVLPKAFYAQAEQHFGCQLNDKPRGRRTIVIRHATGFRIVALIEIVSPSNKDRRESVREFTTKVHAALISGVHVAVVDLFPPNRAAPRGLHGAIWSSYSKTRSDPPTDRPLTLASYKAGEPVEAFVDFLAVGDPMPDMTLFLTPDRTVTLPLGNTYASAFADVPQIWQDVLEGRTVPSAPGAATNHGAKPT